MSKDIIQKSPENHHECFFAYEALTKSEKNIAQAYMIFYEKFKIGEHQKVFPGIETIAFIAKCCRKTVNTFIQKYRGILFTYRSGCKKLKDKYTSNQYELNEDFFDFLILLKANNFLHRWKESAKTVLAGLINNDWYLCTILYQKGMLSTEKLRTAFLGKLRTIRFFLSSYEFHMTKVPKKSAVDKAIKEVKERKSYQSLFGMSLSFAEKERLTDNFGTFALKKAVEDARYVGIHKIYSPCGFLYAKAKQHTLKRYSA